MKGVSLLSVLVLGLFVIGFSINGAFAQFLDEAAFVMDGSGFAVTDSTIKTSQFDFALTTDNVKNGRGSMNIEDGFVTLDDDDYVAENILGTILRDGKFLRISGIAENNSDDITLSLFGRLIEDSAKGSIYSFTGRITQDNISYKMVYTAKLSGLNTIVESTTTLPKSDVSTENIINIIPGSSDIGLGVDYREGYSLGSKYTELQGDNPSRARYFSPDRITVEPGTSVTFVNNDDVSHSIVSGSGLGSSNRLSQGAFVLCTEPKAELPEGFSFLPEGDDSKDCSFSLDGRIATGEIPPGESATVTFEDQGFYRMIDPDYPWMSIVGYSFNDVDSLLINQGKNQLGN